MRSVLSSNFFVAEPFRPECCMDDAIPLATAARLLRDSGQFWSEYASCRPAVLRGCPDFRQCQSCGSSSWAHRTDTQPDWATAETANTVEIPHPK
jgi:hypothetical protein